MKYIIDLTESQIELLKSNGHMILNNGIKYYNLPQWFAETEIGNRAEVFYQDQLPEPVKLFIREVSIQESLERLVFLHSCEQEGIEAGMPPAKDWIDAIEDAKTALNYEI